MADIRLDTSFLTHPKTKKLKRGGGDTAIVSLIALWSYAGVHKQTGVLSNMEDVDISLAADWPGDADVFVPLLINAGFIDDKTPRILHDWKEHQPWVVNAPKRRKQARKAAAKRWGRTRSKKYSQHSDQQCPGPAGSNANSNAPSPSFPNPSPSPNPSPTQVVDMFHVKCPSLPKVQILKPGTPRWKHIQARLKEHPGLAWWGTFFEKVEASDFLTGRSKDWSATIDWIIKPANFTKIIEGNYDNREQGAKQPKRKPGVTTF